MGVDGGVEALEERVAHALLHEQARAGQAHLAGVVVLAGRLGRGGVEVGVLEHDQRALATQLAGERHEVARRRDADLPGGLGRAGERDPAQQRMGDERGAGLLADALQHVEHAGREAGLDRPARPAASTTAATTRPA